MPAMPNRRLRRRQKSPTSTNSDCGGNAATAERSPLPFQAPFTELGRPDFPRSGRPFLFTASPYTPRMRIVTWNVNSVRLRLGLLARMDEALRPDVICLQETK